MLWVGAFRVTRGKATVRRSPNLSALCYTVLNSPWDRQRRKLTTLNESAKLQVGIVGLRRLAAAIFSLVAVFKQSQACQFQAQVMLFGSRGVCSLPSNHRTRPILVYL